MLQNIRDNASGAAAKIIVGLIALTFVVTGVQFVSFSGEPEVAVVNDQPITEQDFLRELDTQRRQLLSLVQDPALIDESMLRTRVLDSLIQQTSVLTTAQARGLSFQDAQIDQLISNAPEFQQDGQFSVALFDQFVGRQGLGRVGFREQLKEQLTVNQWTRGLADSAFVLDAQVQQALALEGQQRSVRWIPVLASDQSIDAQPSDSELQSLYDATTAQWQQPQQVSVDYVLLPRERDLTDIEVDPAELRDAYDRYVQALNATQEPRASHILLTGDDSLAQAEATLARLDAGESFEALARELSQDTLSGELGGDLGFADPSIYAPEFARALESLAVGEVSGAVQTAFGHHIIKLTEAREQQPETFEQRAELLRNQLADSQARIEYEADAEELANIAFSGDLEEAAQVLGLDIQSTERFTQAAGQGIAENLGIRAAAFSDDVQAGENSTLLELEQGALVLRLRDSEPARQLALDEVRESLIELWTAQQQAEAAQTAAQARLSDLTDVQAQSIGRAFDALPSDVVQNIFALPVAQRQVVQAATGDAYALEVVSVTAGAVEDTEGMQAFLASQARQAAGTQLGQWAQSQAVVER